MKLYSLFTDYYFHKTLLPLINSELLKKKTNSKSCIHLVATKTVVWVYSNCTKQKLIMLISEKIQIISGGNLETWEFLPYFCWTFFFLPKMTHIMRIICISSRICAYIYEKPINIEIDIFSMKLNKNKKKKTLQSTFRFRAPHNARTFIMDIKLEKEKSL